MYIEPFKVEIWMNEWETKCTYNMAETCVESLTVEELLQIAGQNEADLNALLPMKLTYGAITGSERLRTAVASIFEDVSAENVTITHGTIAANMLVHKAVLEPGRRVVAVVPTYQQHYSIPASLGAKVEQLKLREEDGFLPDLDRLAEAVTPDTKLIALTNPNNPTGALIPHEILTQIAEIARGVGAYVLCDEVYRGTDQEGSGSTASIVDVYEKGISTGSVSKAFSLAGLRVGWVVGPPEVTEHIHIHRDYDTISVGMINDHLATIALENREKVLARSRAISRGNLAIVDDWIASQAKVSWTRPQSGTTGMLRLDVAVTSRAFCVDLLKATGAMFTPGDAFDMEGYVRIGFCGNTDELKAGLAKTSDYLAALN